jgi:accessory gene regulator B
MVLFLLKKRVIEAENIEVYQYEFEIIFSTIIGFMLIILIGIVFNEILYALLFYSFFVGIRVFTGGYHASTYFKCKLILSIICIIVVALSKYCIDCYNLFVQVISISFYLFSVFTYAPIEHKNAPMNERVKAINRKRSVSISIILAIILTPGYYWNKSISMVVSLTLFVIAFLMIVSEIERRKKNEYNF